jgi:hypothetical protein
MGLTDYLGLRGEEFKGEVAGIVGECSDLVGDFLHAIEYLHAGCKDSFGCS